MSINAPVHSSHRMFLTESRPYFLAFCTCRRKMFSQYYYLWEIFAD